MTSKLRHPGILATLAGLLAFAAPARAVQFRLLGWNSADVNLQFEANQKATEASVYTDTLSPIYEYQGNGPLVLFKMVEHDGKPKKQPACTVPIPADAQQGLIILVPGDDTKVAARKVRPNQFGFVSGDAPLTYDYLWLDDSLAARPSGTLEFRNLSRLPVALQIEQQQLVLAPQSRAQVPLNKGAKRMAFKAAAQVNGTWKVFASNPLSTRNPDRMMVILRDNPTPPEGSASNEPNISMISLFDWAQPAPDIQTVARR